MKRAIATNRGDWVLLEFSVLGFIGRLFHSSSVPRMVEFLLMFYTQKPCDWLMEDYLQVRMCGHGEKWAKCLYKIRCVARPVRPSLFQHLGFRSSLQGHINKLKDKHYRSDVNSTSYAAFSNPPVANIFTTLTTYANDIYDVYTGEKIFWATIPKENDVMEFMFNPPVTLDRIIINTGDAKHPTDILTNAVVEVLQVSPLSRPSPLPGEGGTPPVKHAIHQKAWMERSNTIPELRTWAKTAAQCEGAFVQIGKFDSLGQADISVPPESKIGSIWSLRVRVLATSKMWLVVNKVRALRACCGISSSKLFGYLLTDLK
ncbi:alpha-1,3-mannosyl-glycoprotein 4-beta-n-acetylglucosaminyltransferase a [Plakobranchus ocellatus]|uniref:Alpha-1,3-mannosyl-glycoprotein 4-beta-n-acetylglucosaminyltransferase a n=1 Tax=Plakobranchus ocellatus TaxID=259542 RepID=A0AAV4AT79_9GAST|nr:alpha-1,3-mannosyl-glycoprotein 4-beta-n-acetylglucosaminyltransferase a [Plakobranchus ocellatus]